MIKLRIINHSSWDEPQKDDDMWVNPAYIQTVEKGGEWSYVCIDGDKNLRSNRHVVRMNHRVLLELIAHAK